MTLYLTGGYGALVYMYRIYSAALAMEPVVLCIPYGTSSHEQGDSIISFAHFEEGNLVEEEHVAFEDKSVSTSIYESIYNYKYSLVHLVYNQNTSRDQHKIL